MRFYKHLYYGGIAAGLKNSILKDLKNKKIRPFTFLILINEKGKLEMVHNSMIYGALYKNAEIYVAGIAETKQEGFVVIKNIVNDSRFNGENVYDGFWNCS